jgi:predicted AAA+ superfamily ATPase
MIQRELEKNISDRIHSGKTIVITGARQVGKTTLLKSILKKQDYLFLDGDDPAIRNILNNPNTEEIKSIIGKYSFVFIDEAQRISNIGLTAKIINDRFKSVQLFLSGSSSFDLTNNLNEPLTGRKWEYKLYPISWKELENHFGYVNSQQQLANRLIYGFYPDVINNPGDEIEILKNLTDSYLYRDILAYSDIRKPEILEKLVRALALQIGNEVNYTELAKLLNIDKNTVSKYIDILEKGYVVLKLGTFSGNLRNEIKTNKKIYFYDNGIRNMIIGDFSPFDTRQDKGHLWENFLITERIKRNEYNKVYANQYFWRTKQQQEVDYIEKMDNKIFGFEFKWKSNKNIKFPKTFVEKYNPETKIIDNSNFREFVL